MIRCNLSILLAERNLKITQVSKDTGISRTTLTSLSNNYSQGIQFDTINTLCNYLKVTPEQLITYVPIDIKIVSSCANTLKKYASLNDNELSLILCFAISDNNKSKYCRIPVKCYLNFDSEKNVNSIDIVLNLFTANDETQIDNLFFVNSLKKLPVPFFNYLESYIISWLVSSIKLKYKVSKTPKISINWDNILNY
ncbi:MAG: helix-turn-helix transcriptional regulator [Clostridium perfringens]|nr:helix-turn-helix transcriptional regulator [Clostridium perfringens]